MDFFIQVFSELFKSPVGLLSMLTIGVIFCIATFLFFWVKKQTEKDAAKAARRSRSQTVSPN